MKIALGEIYWKLSQLLLAVILISVLTITLIGCNLPSQTTTPTDDAEEFIYNMEDVSEFNIAIFNGDIEYFFTKDDLSSYTLRDITTITTRNSEQMTDKWKGIKLADILIESGIDGDIINLKYRSSDYYKTTVEVEDINNFYIVLYKKEGNQFISLSTNDIRIICSTDAFQSNWARKLVSIEINPLILPAASVFSIQLLSDDITFVVNNNILNKLELYEVTTLTSKNDVWTENWLGIRLSELLTEAGITDDVVSITFEDNGDPKYSRTYSSIVNIDNYYVVLYEKTNESYVALSSNEIKNLSTDDIFQMNWVRGLHKISIN